MAKFIKYILMLLIGIIVLLVIAGVVVTSVINPNDYKDDIASMVKQQTGRDLSIGSDIKLSFFPWVGVNLGDVQLSNPDGFSDKNMLDVKELSAFLKISPLFSGNIEIDTIVIDGLNLNVQKKADGTDNWSDLAKGQAAEKTPEDKTKDDSAKDFIKGLSINGVKILNGALKFSDDSTGQTSKIENLDFVTGVIVPGQPVSIDLSLKLSTSDQMTISQSIKGHFQIRDDFKALTIPDLLTSTQIDGKTLPKSLSIDTQVDLFVDLAADIAKLNNLNIKTDGVELKLQADVKALSSKSPQFTASVKTNEINIASLLDSYKISYKTTDDKVLQKLVLSFQLKGNPNNIALSDLNILLDDTQFSGNARLINETPLNIYARLSGDDIDVDRYLPPASEKKQVASTDAEKTGKTKTENPKLPNITADMEFKMGHVKVSNLHINDLLLALTGKNKVFRIAPMKASLYSGNTTINATIDGSKDTPKFKVSEVLKNVNIGVLLMDLMGEDQLTGNANLNFDITTVGWDVDQQKRNLNGKAKFAFKNGAVKGFNIAQSIRQVSGVLTGKPIKDEAPAQTDFSALKGTATIKNGVVTNNDFTASSPLLRISGKGKLNIPASTVDYRVKTHVVDTLEGQDGKALKELQGVPIPVHITGPLDNISVKPELDEVFKQKAKKEIQNKVQETIQKKLGGQAGDLFKSFFK